MTRAEDIDKALNDQATAITDAATRVATEEKNLQDTIDQLNKTAGDGLTGPQTEAAIARIQASLTNLGQIGKATQAPPVVPPAVPGPFAQPK